MSFNDYLKYKKQQESASMFTLKPPKGLTFIAETIVGYSDNQISEILGTAYLKFSPYFVFLIIL